MIDNDKWGSNLEMPLAWLCFAGTAGPSRQDGSCPGLQMCQCRATALRSSPGKQEQPWDKTRTPIFTEPLSSSISVPFCFCLCPNLCAVWIVKWHIMITNGLLSGQWDAVVFQESWCRISQLLTCSDRNARSCRVSNHLSTVHNFYIRKSLDDEIPVPFSPIHTIPEWVGLGWEGL